jgi:hypothetical protein
MGKRRTFLFTFIFLISLAFAQFGSVEVNFLFFIAPEQSIIEIHFHRTELGKG